MRPRYTPIWKTHHGLLGKLIRLPLRLLPPSARIKIPTGINRGATWVVGSGRHQCWMGTYERAMQDVICRLVRPGMVAWDVGANVGFYTVALSNLVGSNGHVVAFEPDGLNAAYLLRHIELNKVTNVQVVQAAVCSSVGLISFSVGAASTNGAIVDASCLKVPSLSPDEFLSTRNGMPPDFMKIDVEGAEAEVLMGSARLLAMHKPDLVVAMHSPEAKRACAEILKRAGYSLYNLAGNRVTEIGCDEILARVLR